MFLPEIFNRPTDFFKNFHHVASLLCSVDVFNILHNFSVVFNRNERSSVQEEKYGWSSESAFIGCHILSFIFLIEGYKKKDG